LLEILERRLVNSSFISQNSICITDGLGKSKSAAGRGSVRKDSVTRRFIRCLVTERRAVFLDTITACPLASFGRTAVKCADDNLRPSLSAEGNITRESRFFCGNTIDDISDRKSLAAGSTASQYNLTASNSRIAREKPVRYSTLAFLWLIRSFGHIVLELGYTHDTNRFSPKHHWCLTFFMSVYS